MGLGLTLSVLGPVLLDLAVQTKSSLTAVGYCVVVRSFGYLLGSTGGTLYDHWPGHYVLAAAMLSSALGTALIPSAPSIVALGVLVVLQGVGMGLNDTGCNVMLIFWYGADVGPIMQTLHFAFALGACLGPLLLRLVAAMSSDHSEDVAGGPVGQGNYDGAFYIIASFNVMMSVLLLGRASPRPRTHGAAPALTGAPAPAAAPALAEPPSEALETIAAPDAVEVQAAAPQPEWAARGAVSAGADLSRSEAPAAEVAVPAPSTAPGAASATASASSASAGATISSEIHVPDALLRDVWIVVVLVGVLLGIYVGCETGFGAFITSYMVVGLGRPESEAQFLAGAYWAAITVGRFASIFVAMRFLPRDYLGVSMAGCCVASIFLLAFASSPACVWAFGCIYGLFMACVFPTGIAYAESVFPVQGKHITIFVVGSATGEMLLPFIISTLFGGNVDPATGAVSRSSDGPGPLVMMVVVCVATCINMAVYALLVRKGAALKLAIDAAAAKDRAPL